MEKFLKDYIERMRPVFAGYRKRPHTLLHRHFSRSSSSYTRKPPVNVRRPCRNLPEGNGNDALKKALTIADAYAKAFENAQVRPDVVPAFTDAEQAFLAVNLSPELNEDPSTLELDNSLLLLYAVAVIASPDDEQALDEHRKYVIKMLDTYKRALGIP